MAAALDIAESPVLFSHSGAYAVNPHVRNVPDEILRRIPANGGVVMAVFLSQFVSDEVRRHVEPGMQLEEAFERDHPDARASAAREVRRTWLAANPPPPATLGQLADHIDHLVEVMGPRYVGIGSDFDGGELLPVGLEDAATRGMTSARSPAATSCASCAAPRRPRAGSRPSDRRRRRRSRRSTEPADVDPSHVPERDNDGRRSGLVPSPIARSARRDSTPASRG
jgi:hypothetical protein